MAISFRFFDDNLEHFTKEMRKDILGNITETKICTKTSNR